MPDISFPILPPGQRRVTMHRIASVMLPSGRSNKLISAFPYNLVRL
jgi:hypothetical protein